MNGAATLTGVYCFSQIFLKLILPIPYCSICNAITPLVFSAVWSSSINIAMTSSVLFFPVAGQRFGKGQ